MAKTRDGRLEALGNELDRMKAEYEAAKRVTSSRKAEKDRAYSDVAWAKSEIANLKRCIDDEFRSASICHQCHDYAGAKNHSLNGRNMKQRLDLLYMSKKRAYAEFDSYRAAFSEALEHQRRVKARLDSAREAFQERLREVQAQNKRERAKWHEKRCKLCGATFRYHEDWTHVPSLCPNCREKEKAKWKEKRCEGCGSTIRYRVDWEHQPNYCKSCKASYTARTRRATPRRTSEGDSGLRAEP